MKNCFDRFCDRMGFLPPGFECRTVNFGTNCPIAAIVVPKDLDAETRDHLRKRLLRILDEVCPALPPGNPG